MGASVGTGGSRRLSTQPRAARNGAFARPKCRLGRGPATRLVTRVVVFLLPRPASAWNMACPSQDRGRSRRPQAQSGRRHGGEDDGAECGPGRRQRRRQDDPAREHAVRRRRDRPQGQRRRRHHGRRQQRRGARPADEHRGQRRPASPPTGSTSPSSTARARSSSSRTPTARCWAATPPWSWSSRCSSG